MRRMAKFALAILVVVGAGRFGFAQGLTTVGITDPAYGVKAFNITIPADGSFRERCCRGQSAAIFRTLCFGRILRTG
jgi:hypothetical protein